jgi:hypothetical protein
LSKRLTSWSIISKYISVKSNKLCHLGVVKSKMKKKD